MSISIGACRMSELDNVHCFSCLHIGFLVPIRIWSCSEKVQHSSSEECLDHVYLVLCVDVAVP